MKKAPNAMTRNKAGLAALTTCKKDKITNETFPISFSQLESPAKSL